MRATTHLCVLLVGGLLSACAVTPRVPGTASAASVPDGVGSVAADAVQLLQGRYPPGATYWTLARPARDGFGVALVDTLRRQGYAVQEASASRGKPQPAPAGPTLDYVFEPVDAGVYRLTLQIGTRSMSRAYMAAGNGRMQPAGAWSHKE
ncbi:hypothetical protein [Stenotrophomonas rhizophila]|uniref:hypothetical protein n=1 Tax=Stenotrophomonas rhizophila TaxID=216778 RepID=UPI001E390119|nr:hypothetical protein [Stenotrophomonas rhizophila]MCC7634553.1 conjugal transfer protein TrbH [Stenotrophomonas rhizophila]MCC7664178.1 conjugal transfer protein TrbH [Stenotrophomonas rhizophila]